MNNCDTGLLSGVVFAASLFAGASALRAAVMPLEWNVRYPTDVPYEVEISPAKLNRLAGVKEDCSFVVKADGRALETTALLGKAPGTVDLRFRVPAGTKRLACETRDGTPRTLHRADETDNLFAGALDGPQAWTFETAPGARTAATATPLATGGLRLAARGGSATAVCTVAVPAALRGQSVKLALDCVSRTPLAWGGMIRIAQLDAQGKTLPESLSDPRWTSHIRPPDCATPYRERGRLHPAAHRLALRIELRHHPVTVDNDGLPLADPAACEPVLDVTQLAVRPAAELPFPKYDDSLFAPGVSGAEGDTAIVLGGARAFWYQTHSQALWAENRPLREEAQLFFPSGAGTVEAWFRPTVFRPGTTYLFEACHHGSRIATGPDDRPSVNSETLGTMAGVSYEAAEEKLAVTFRDYRGKSFAGTVRAALPLGAWTHLALAWTPGVDAKLFVNGRCVLSMPLAGYAVRDLKRLAQPNAFGPVEFYLGSTFRAARQCDARDARFPFYEGAADALRVSSGVRYATDFTPAKAFACDADTRALFTFDRSFDGVSGGGLGWISGTWRACVDRVDHRLAVDGRTVPYYPAEPLPEADPQKVLAIDNYPNLPTERDFAASRAFKSRTATMRNGDVFRLSAPEGVYTEFVEVANDADRPLVFPALVRKGEIDPRSFGDIRASLLAGPPLADRERANRVFQFVLGASDYFMSHQATFDPHSDVPRMVEYDALTMLNAYCGFECGPLNNLAANLFACAGGCAAGQTYGYGHSFEQVFYAGKNHTYDLSAQQFFTALDNETAACLEEEEEQPGCHYRLGKSANAFIRLTNRVPCAQNPAFQRKVAVTLNPGERFRMWFLNDGACNDLQFCSCFGGNRRIAPTRTMPRSALDPYEEDYVRQAHAKLDPAGTLYGYPHALTRIDRFFPHYGNGFITFAGRPDAANPAFDRVRAQDFCYRVESPYPIVAATYAAARADGTPVPLEICTDGREYRPLALAADGAAHLDYAVRARTAYALRVKAPLSAVASFRASTEVMANARIFPGKLVPGENELRFKACSETPARVTLGWSERAKPIAFAGALRSGTIPGLERHVTVLDPLAGAKTLAVTGVSAAATVEATAGLAATLRDGTLTLQAKAARGSVECVTVRDGDAVKELTVVVAPQAKLLLASDAQLAGGARRTAAGQSAVALRKIGDGASFAVPALGPGAWCAWNLTRWESHSRVHRARPLCLTTDKTAAIPAAGPMNTGMQFFKAHYGKAGERAQWKWDHVLSPHSFYPYPLMHRLALAGATRLDFTLGADLDQDVELAAVLVMPYPDQAFKCRLLKALGGFNYDPWRMRD